MRPAFAIGLSLFFCAFPSRAEEPAESVVSKVKRATVFIRVETPKGKGSGSGFVVSVGNDSALIATNFHVVAGGDFDALGKPSPAEASRMLKVPTITVVFDSGMKTERSFKAGALVGDPTSDLAILKVDGLKDPPPPVEHAEAPKLYETMPVFIFGFPFGQSLSLGSASPAITVGKGSISSIRNNEEGEVGLVQIDGNVNPGNSGGPIVDEKGRLAGVAVATIKGSGIGMAVPRTELDRLMKGRFGEPRLTAVKTADGKVKVTFEVGLLDPAGAMTVGDLHYVVAATDADRPKAGSRIDQAKGAAKAALKVSDGVATAEIILDKVDGTLVAQSISGAGTDARVSIARSVRLGGAGAAGKPPEGWEEYTTQPFRTFTVWLPNGARKSEQDNTSTIRTLRLRTISLRAELPGNVVYEAERLVLPLDLKLNRRALEASFLDFYASEMRGKVVEQNDVVMSEIPGKENLIAAGGILCRLRVFVGYRGAIFVIRAKGPKAQIEEADTLTFLDSFHIPKADTPENPAPMTGEAPKINPPVAGPKNKGDATAILGFGLDPEFKDVGPEGTVLVGLEVTTGKFLNNDVVKAVRPIYRKGDNDTPGELHGLNLPNNVVKLVAKPGYAVGAVTAKTGLGIDGVSVTFVKYADGKLDFSDSYESDWVGGKGGGRPTTVKSDGRPLVGILGRTSQSRMNELTGIGLQMMPK